MFYLKLFETLNEHGVRYLVVGGLAMNLHGVPRMTMDVDLILHISEANLGNFVDAARKLSLTPIVPVKLDDLLNPATRREWLEKRHMIAFGLRPPRPEAPTVDLLLVSPLDFEEAYERAMVIRIGSLLIKVVGLEDLMTMKQIAGRQQDQADIEHLRRLLAGQRRRDES